MKQYNHIIVIGVASVVLLQGIGARGVDMNEGSGATHRMGMGLVAVSFPTRGEVWDVSLKWSVDGHTFGSANIGLPRPWNLFRSVSYDQQQTTVLIPVAGFFATNPKMLFFQDSGRHWFRVQVNFRDASKPRSVPDQVDNAVEPLVIEQILDVGPAIQADLDFIAGLGAPDLMRAMYGEDFFERQTGNAIEQYADPEQRALKVIGRLLRATRERDPGSIGLPKGNVLRAADMLVALAKELPDSSYAPYAAYYAGCCYLTTLAESSETMLKEKGIKYPARNEEDRQTIASFVKGQAEYAKAKESLDLAISKADAYLKPRAMYMKVCLPMLTSDWDEAEDVLHKAVTEAGGTGTIQKLVDRARRDIRHAKGKYAERKAEPGRSSTP